MRYLLTLLALAGMYVSVLALRVHNQDPNAVPPCAVTERFDCGTVNHSRFAVFPPRLFDEDPHSGKLHMPVATMGIAGYGLMAVAAVFGQMGVLLVLAEIGFFFAAMLSYLEAYVIQKWCIYCLWSQGIVLTILVLATAVMTMRWMAARRVTRRRV